MFYAITGNVSHIEAQAIVLETGGISFYLQTTLTTLKQVGECHTKQTLFTYLNVREDALDLFGFATQEELSCFKLLISVSGVGPKAGLAILSELTPDQLTLALAAGDTKALTRAPGIGPKIAKRIVLELKDKLAKNLTISTAQPALSKVSEAVHGGNTAEAIEALTMLGYSGTEAATAVAGLSPELSVEELIKHALKSLSK